MDHVSPASADVLLKPNYGYTVVEGIITLAVCAVLIVLIMRSLDDPRSPTQCRRHLRQIALAMRSYEEKYHALPPAYTVDANGKRLHSWRTLILPILEFRALYESIDLSKAPDDPANAGVFKEALMVYSCPAAHCLRNYTTYLAVVGDNACLLPTRARPLSDIKDGPAETLMVVEVDSDRAVHWMSPFDADEETVLSIGTKAEPPHVGGMNAAFADGHVQSLQADTPPVRRRALMSINGHDNPPHETR